MCTYRTSKDIMSCEKTFVEYSGKRCILNIYTLIQCELEVEYTITDDVRKFNIMLQTCDE